MSIKRDGSEQHGGDKTAKHTSVIRENICESVEEYKATCNKLFSVIECARSANMSLASRSVYKLQAFVIDIFLSQVCAYVNYQNQW